MFDGDLHGSTFTRVRSTSANSEDLFPRWIPSPSSRDTDTPAGRGAGHSSTLTRCCNCGTPHGCRATFPQVILHPTLPKKRSLPSTDFCAAVRQNPTCWRISEHTEIAWKGCCAGLSRAFDAAVLSRIGKKILVHQFGRARYPKSQCRCALEDRRCAGRSRSRIDRKNRVKDAPANRLASCLAP